MTIYLQHAPAGNLVESSTIPSGKTGLTMEGKPVIKCGECNRCIDMFSGAAIPSQSVVLVDFDLHIRS